METVIKFKCCLRGAVPEQWEGIIQIFKKGDPCEIAVTARGCYFHIIAGKHAHGYYICIPNWNVGTELACFADVFWNSERLEQYTELNKVDACTVATALDTLRDYL